MRHWARLVTHVSDKGFSLKSFYLKMLFFHTPSGAAEKNVLGESPLSESRSFNPPNGRDYLGIIRGVSLMRPEPSGNRVSANYRYYCDNDPRVRDGTSRWKLKEDLPWAIAPVNYVRQSERPMPHEAQQLRQAYQEWYDSDNYV